MLIHGTTCTQSFFIRIVVINISRNKAYHSFASHNNQEADSRQDNNGAEDAHLRTTYNWN